MSCTTWENVRLCRLLLPFLCYTLIMVMKLVILFFTVWILLLWLRLLASFTRCHGLLGNRAIIISFLGPLFSLGLSIDLKLMVEEAGLNDLLWIPIHGLNLLLVTFAKGLCFYFLYFFPKCGLDIIPLLIFLLALGLCIEW